MNRASIRRLFFREILSLYRKLILTSLYLLSASYSCQLDPLKKHIFHTSALAAAAVDSLTIPARFVILKIEGWTILND